MARLNIAMLAQEAQQVGPVEQQTELEVVGQQAEDAIAEAVEQQNEIEQTQQAMDETEEVIQEVEEERQELEQAQQRGGAEPVAMEALQRAVKRFEKRTGVACSVKSMGLESFGSKATRMRSTSIAMEGAVDYIKKLIKMLMDAVAAVWEKVKAFAEKIMVGAERLAKRAKQVEESAKAAQGKKAPADAKVKTASVLAFARMGNKAVEGGDFAKAFIAQTANTFSVRKGREASLADFVKGDTLSTILEESKKADNKEALAKAVLVNHIAKDGKAENGTVTIESPERLLGDYAAVGVYLPRDATWGEISANYNKIKSTIEVAKDAKDDPKEVAPMSPEDARKVANQAAGHMHSYSDMRDEQNKIDAEVKKLMTKAKELEKADNAPTEQIRVATGVVRAIVNNVLQSLVAYRSYDIKLTKAALDYAAASVNLASGKDATGTGTQVAVVNAKK